VAGQTGKNSCGGGGPVSDGRRARGHWGGDRGLVQYYDSQKVCKDAQRFHHHFLLALTFTGTLKRPCQQTDGRALMPHKNNLETKPLENPTKPWYKTEEKAKRENKRPILS